MLLVQLMARAFSRALESAGSSMEARIAMMAMTTSNSIRVNVFFIKTPGVEGDGMLNNLLQTNEKQMEVEKILPIRFSLQQ